MVSQPQLRLLHPSSNFETSDFKLCNICEILLPQGLHRSRGVWDTPLNPTFQLKTWTVEINCCAKRFISLPPNSHSECAVILYLYHERALLKHHMTEPWRWWLVPRVNPSETLDLFYTYNHIYIYTNITRLRFICVYVNIAREDMFQNLVTEKSKTFLLKVLHFFGAPSFETRPERHKAYLPPHTPKYNMEPQHVSWCPY